jgi:hypothetical protein
VAPCSLLGIHKSFERNWCLLLPWRWRQQFHSKCWYASIKWHDATFQNTASSYSQPWILQVSYNLNSIRYVCWKYVFCRGFIWRRIYVIRMRHSAGGRLTRFFVVLYLANASSRPVVFLKRSYFIYNRVYARTFHWNVIERRASLISHIFLTRHMK